MKSIIKRIIVIGVLTFLTGLIFYALHTMMIKSVFWYDEWIWVEKALYIVFALLIGTIYKYLYDVLKKYPAKIIVSMGLAATFTVGVFLANNYFHYLHWNAIIFNWRYDFPYSHFVKYDLQYKVGYGEFRYIVVFLAMCLANFAIVVYFKRISPVLKKWIQKVGLWYFGPDESTLEHRIQRLLTGADYTDFIDEINCMPINKETKDVFKKLISKYDEECKMVELYQALFIRYGQFLTKEEYLEYRQKYLENFDDPLPNKCAALDEMHLSTTCSNT